VEITRMRGELLSTPTRAEWEVVRLRGKRMRILCTGCTSGTKTTREHAGRARLGNGWRWGIARGKRSRSENVHRIPGRGSSLEHGLLRWTAQGARSAKTSSKMFEHATSPRRSRP
jgi:hypothetical protein